MKCYGGGDQLFFCWSCSGEVYWLSLVDERIQRSKKNPIKYYSGRIDNFATLDFAVFICYFISVIQGRLLDCRMK